MTALFSPDLLCHRGLACLRAVWCRKTQKATSLHCASTQQHACHKNLHLPGRSAPSAMLTLSEQKWLHRQFGMLSSTDVRCCGLSWYACSIRPRGLAIRAGAAKRHLAPGVQQWLLLRQHWGQAARPTSNPPACSPWSGAESDILHAAHKALIAAVLQPFQTKFC